MVQFEIMIYIYIINFKKFEISGKKIKDKIAEKLTTQIP